jgi:hypothetical protein
MEQSGSLGSGRHRPTYRRRSQSARRRSRSRSCRDSIVFRHYRQLIGVVATSRPGSFSQLPGSSGGLGLWPTRPGGRPRLERAGRRTRLPRVRSPALVRVSGFGLCTARRGARRLVLRWAGCSWPPPAPSELRPSARRAGAAGRLRGRGRRTAAWSWWPSRRGSRRGVCSSPVTARLPGWSAPIRLSACGPVRSLRSPPRLGGRRRRRPGRGRSCSRPGRGVPGSRTPGEGSAGLRP